MPLFQGFIHQRFYLLQRQSPRLSDALHLQKGRFRRNMRV